LSYSALSLVRQEQADSQNAEQGCQRQIIATSALMSGENPVRIMAHSLIGKVLSVPVTSS
jgi:hypothetical protein